MVDMEGGRTYLSAYCASGAHADSGPTALEARVLLQGGRSGGRGMTGTTTARKTECRRSASYLWNGRSLASQTLASSHRTKSFVSPNFQEPKWNPKDTSARTSLNTAYAGSVGRQKNT